MWQTPLLIWFIENQGIVILKQASQGKLLIYSITSKHKYLLAISHDIGNVYVCHAHTTLQSSLASRVGPRSRATVTVTVHSSLHRDLSPQTQSPGVAICYPLALDKKMN